MTKIRERVTNSGKTYCIRLRKIRDLSFSLTFISYESAEKWLLENEVKFNQDPGKYFIELELLKKKLRENGEYTKIFGRRELIHEGMILTRRSW